jgi:hypothetical protein
LLATPREPQAAPLQPFIEARLFSAESLIPKFRS